MRAEVRQQARRALDRELRAVSVPTRPRPGWIRAIRDALGMSTSELGARLGITAQGVTGLESSEQHDSIRLGTLRRTADALGCDLLYALVPRDPNGLDGAVLRQARARATRELAPVRHTMLLEAQAVPEDGEEEDQELLAQQLIAGRGLWATTLQ